MPSCSIAGGCKHPLQLTNHICSNGCKRDIHATCAFEAFGLEGVYRCTEEGPCSNAAPLTARVAPLPLADQPEPPQGSVQVTVGGITTFCSLVQPPWGGKNAKQPPSAVWLHFEQFTPPVEVRSQKGRILLKNVKCIVKVEAPAPGAPLAECGALLSYTSKEGPGNLTRHLETCHKPENAQFQELSNRGAAAQMEKAKMFSQGENGHVVYLRPYMFQIPRGSSCTILRALSSFPQKQERSKITGSLCRQLNVPSTTQTLCCGVL